MSKQQYLLLKKIKYIKKQVILENLMLFNETICNISYLIFKLRNPKNIIENIYLLYLIILVSDLIFKKIIYLLLKNVFNRAD